MTYSKTSRLIQNLRSTMLLDWAEMTDGQLLEAFVQHGDHAALAALVHRHGQMVWSVCHRLLRSDDDAEDAFQATFLVLVRKAAAIRDKKKVANWLFGVARQTAVRARTIAAKRSVRERQVMEMPEPAVAEHDPWTDLLPLLDQELSRLPASYRVAVVLCDLEGRTRQEVARQLGWPEGTVAGRLARARAMLAKRLSRYGPTVYGGALAAMLSQHAASAGVLTSVVSSTIKAATGFAMGEEAIPGAVSMKVASLTEGVLKDMWIAKLKITAAILLVCGTVGLGILARSVQAAGVLQGNQRLVALSGAENEPKENPATTEEDKLKGNWTLTSAEFNGKIVAAKDLQDLRLIVTADKMISKQGDQTMGEVTFKLNPNKKPKEIETTRTSDPGKGERRLGIYVLDGDTLKVCGSEPGKERPTEFATKEGSLHLLYLYKRTMQKP